MPIRQLKPKNSDNKSTGFTTRSFGSRTASNGTPRMRRGTGEARNRADRLALARGIERKPGRRKSRMSRKIILGYLGRAVLILILSGGIGIALLFAIYSRDLPDPNKIIERNVPQSTRIYDRTGETLLYEIHGTERRTLIELSTVPQYAIDATVAIEDKNFFKHGGFSLPHVAKAIVLEIAKKIGLYRGLVPGGSTLTQQFIKNAVLTTEKSYERKIKELILSYRMEKKFTKEEILKLYFNEIPYGSTAYGIEAASHIYFDKSAHDLNLGEAAILAALPQAPTYYSPYGSHKDELLGRQRYILKLMAEQGYITEDEAQTAAEQEIFFKKRREDIRAPHFVFMVKEQLALRYGDRLVEQGGLTIVTTLDYEKQKIAEEAITAQEKINAESYEARNAALVSIDAATSEVVALVGSKDYFNDDIDGQVNVATSLRQPGSSIKPVVYAAAFNQGYHPETVVYDLITSFAASGKPYEPHNYDSKERGPVSLRSALAGSLNIPSVKVLYLAGVKNVIELARELGYSTLTDPDRYGLSLVLGGAEVKLIEHVNAYAAFAREGVAKPYVTVLKVTDATGAVLEEHHDEEGKRALPREVARTLTNILSDNDARTFIFGAQNRLTLPGRSVAAKTGTTNDYHDAWTLGYTPQLATGVWVGNADNAAMKRGADGSVVAAPIWQTYMSKALEATPVITFKAPESALACDKPMFCGGTGRTTAKINIETGKLAGPYTPASKIREVAYQETHSILHYVDRSDPTGAAPEHPESDPQYALWEGPVKKWAEAQSTVNQKPPTEVDDIYSPEDQPSVSIIMPENGETISENSYTFSVQASARRGIARVSYYLNNMLVGTAAEAPFSFLFTPGPVTPNGLYMLAAVASDDIGNEQRNEIIVNLNVQRPEGEWSVRWAHPLPGASIARDAFSEELVLAVTNPGQLKKIDFYATHDGDQKFIGAQDVAGKSAIMQPWKQDNAPGLYALSLVITDNANSTFSYPEIAVTITE